MITATISAPDACGAIAARGRDGAACNHHVAGIVIKTAADARTAKAVVAAFAGGGERAGAADGERLAAHDGDARRIFGGACRHVVY